MIVQGRLSHSDFAHGCWTFVSPKFEGGSTVMFERHIRRVIPARPITTKKQDRSWYHLLGRGMETVARRPYFFHNGRRQRMSVLAGNNGVHYRGSPIIDNYTKGFILST